MRNGIETLFPNSFSSSFWTLFAQWLLSLCRSESILASGAGSLRSNELFVALSWLTRFRGCRSLNSSNGASWSYFGSLRSWCLHKSLQSVGIEVLLQLDAAHWTLLQSVLLCSCLFVSAATDYLTTSQSLIHHGRVFDLLFLLLTIYLSHVMLFLAHLVWLLFIVVFLPIHLLLLLLLLL